MRTKQRNSLVIVSAITLTLLVATLAYHLVRSQEYGALEAKSQVDARERVQALDHEMQTIAGSCVGVFRLKAIVKGF